MLQCQITTILPGVTSTWVSTTKPLQMHQEALEKKRAQYGPGHRSTLRSMVNLANVYHMLGRYDEALKLRLETWELQKTNLGHEDTDTLMTAHNIGSNYRKLQRYADALRTDEETLESERPALAAITPIHSPACGTWRRT